MEENVNNSNRQVFLTTLDNPYDYFNEFDKWYAYDQGRGYKTLEYLARILVTSNALSEEQQHKDLEQAIDEIIEYDALYLQRGYKKVYSDEKAYEEFDES